jgi:DNA polymerase III delta prime subunit
MEGQKALRNTIEEYSSICRFILTANYKHKIIQALQSRCQELSTIPPLEGVLKRILSILSTEKISISEDQKVILAKFVKRLYPDVRKIINELQKKCTGATLSITVTESYNTLIKKILEYTLSKKAQDARKYLIENEDKFQADYVALLREMFNILNDISDFKSDKDKKRLLIIAEHLYRSAFVVDQEINFYSCLLNLETI